MKEHTSFKLEELKRDDLNLKIPRTSSTCIPAGSMYSSRSAMKHLAFASAVLAVIGLIIASYENELHFENNFQRTYYTEILRSSVLCISISQLALIYAYYQKKLEFKKAYKEISRRSRVWDDPALSRLYVIELLVNGLCIPPFLSASFTVNQLNTHQTLSTDDIFYIISFLKLYHLAKLFHEFSSTNSERARMYCNLLNENPNALFTLKGIVKNYPLLCISGLFGLVLLILGIILRVCERTIPDSRLTWPWNGFWLIGVTQTSVGYGEMHPFSHLGRTICFLAAGFGIFLHSYAVLIINRKLFFTKTQLYFFMKVKLNKRSRIALRNEAALLIQKWWQKKRATGIERFKLFCVLLDKVNDFSRKRRKIISQKHQSLQQQITETSKNSIGILSSCIAFLDQTFEIQHKSTALVREQYSILKKIQSFSRFAGEFAVSSPFEGSLSVRSFISERINNRKKRDQALISHFSKMIVRITKGSDYLSSHSLAQSDRFCTMRNFE